MIKCPTCGKELDETREICPECGAPLGAPADANPTATSSQDSTAEALNPTADAESAAPTEPAAPAAEGIAQQTGSPAEAAAPAEPGNPAVPEPPEAVPAPPLTEPAPQEAAPVPPVPAEMPVPAPEGSVPAPGAPAFVPQEMPGTAPQLNPDGTMAFPVRRRNPLKIILPIVGAVIILVVAGILTFNYIDHDNHYKAAKQLMDGGEYAEARAAFVELDGFRDSRERVEECDIREYNSYVQSLNVYLLFTLLDAQKAEEICNLTYQVWYNSIFNKSDSETKKYMVYGGDFNDALANLYADYTVKSKLESIQSGQTTVAGYYQRLRNPSAEFTECYEAAKDLQAAYTALTDLALSPSGSLNTYVDSKSEKIEDFLTAYKQLKTLVPEEKENPYADEEESSVSSEFSSEAE